jgi:hypothetical protein
LIRYEQFFDKIYRFSLVFPIHKNVYFWKLDCHLYIDIDIFILVK